MHAHRWTLNSLFLYQFHDQKALFKVPKEGEVNFILRKIKTRHTLKKACACISYYLALIPPCIYATISIIKKLQHNFPKMRGGGQRPFGIFPKNNPIWYRDHSLRPVLSACPTVSMILKKWVSAGYIAWVTSSTWAAPLARERWVGAASKIPNLSSRIIGQTV